MADLSRRALAQKKASGRATMPQKPSKYRNVKTVVGGERFDSKREAAYWQGLLARQAVGEIRNLRRQVPFSLLAPQYGEPKGSGFCPHVVVAVYIADFVFEDYDNLNDEWSDVVVDAKGKRTQMYALKKKWLELQEGIVIVEV